jgi:hypothetical protein
MIPRAPQDHRGHPMLRDYFQCKWHVRSGEFGHADFADAEFINAKSAHAAQISHAPLTPNDKERKWTCPAT